MLDNIKVGEKVVLCVGPHGGWSLGTIEKIERHTITVDGKLFSRRTGDRKDGNRRGHIATIADIKSDISTTVIETAKRLGI